MRFCEAGHGDGAQGEHEREPPQSPPLRVTFPTSVVSTFRKVLPVREYHAQNSPKIGNRIEAPWLKKISLVWLTSSAPSATPWKARWLPPSRNRSSAGSARSSASDKAAMMAR